MGDKFRPCEELGRGNKYDECIRRGFKYPFITSLSYCKTSLLLKKSSAKFEWTILSFCFGKTEARR